ncbi:MAG: transglycosylase SLT domain-containing protein [Xanthobacteraceae bacterium]|nr:transglycosylase SLT domain-containing protein [Xanthobacteraceae bacterium]
MNIEQTASTPAVTGAIRQAARVTGADFKYLLATAQVESNFNADAQARTSSAKGLFQFIEQTWLGTLKETGGALGYAPYANAISRQPSGQYTVGDPRMYDRIMELRSDPNANALMAGAYTRANAGKLGERLGRAPTEGELYIAHFMGPQGAARLIELAQERPYTPAAAVFSGPARANPQVFYDARGNARGAAEVYRSLVGRYGVARGGPANKVAPQLAGQAGNLQDARQGQGAGEQRVVGVVKPGKPMVVPEQIARAGEANQVAGASAPSGPVFHGLFRSTGSPEPVSPLVSALWSNPAPPPSAAAPAKPQPLPETSAPAAAGGPLDLFQEQLPDARALFRGRV